MTPPGSSEEAAGSGQASVRAHKRRLRKPISCEPCRKSKLKCDRQMPCNACRRRNCVHTCTYATSVRSELPDPGVEPATAANQIRPEHPGAATVTPLAVHDTPSEHGEGASSAGDLTHERWEEVLQRPMDHSERSAFTRHVASSLFPMNAELANKDILAMLPPPDCCDYLISRFFLHQSPFFHILHGPTFQGEYNGFVDSPEGTDLSWLALLFVILSVGIKSMEYDVAILEDMWPGRSQSQDWNAISSQLLEAAMMSLSKNRFMTIYRLSSLQALLLMAYVIGHSEGVERAWTLLGIALNIAIALQCNLEPAPSSLTRIEVERRRRCWTGLLSLYTYQAVSFPGLDMILLTNDRAAALPADVNDIDIHENHVSKASSHPTQMSVMTNKIRLFQLSTKICRFLRGPDKYNEATRDKFDAEIAQEQRRWDEAYLIDNRRNVLQFTSYSFWAFFQLHAHHLYLLIHQPFCRSRSKSTGFRQQSRARCIHSGAMLLDLHRQLWECQRLRPFRWTLDGLMSFYALHGAVALSSCLLEDDPGSVESRLQYREAFTSAVTRIAILQPRSAICEKAYPILHHLQALLFPSQRPQPENTMFVDSFDTWVDNQQWITFGSIDWNFFDGIVGEANGL